MPSTLYFLVIYRRRATGTEISQIMEVSHPEEARHKMLTYLASLPPGWEFESCQTTEEFVKHCMQAPD